MVRSRNRISRRSLLAASGGAVAALVAGCGGEHYTQTVGSMPGKFGKRTHIILWHSYAGELRAFLHKLIDTFNAQQNDIYVEAQFQGGYENTMQKLATAIVAKQIPDMVTLSEITWRKMHLADALEPMNDYFGGELTPEMYMEQFLDEGTVQGRIWWIPFARSTPMFYYNKSVFDKVGLPDRGPKTWTELKEWAPELMRVSTSAGKPKTLALGATYASWYFQGNVWQWGGNYSDGLEIQIGHETPIEAGNWMVDFIRKDKAAYLSQTPDVDFGNAISVCTMLSTGSLRRTTGLAEAAGFELGTSFLPEHEHFGCPTGGSGLGIMRHAPKERKAAAFEFIKFLATPENSAAWTMASGYMPVIKAAQQDPALVKLTKEDPNFKTSLRQLPKTQPQDLVRPLVSSAGDMMDQGLQKLYSSGASVEDVFGRLQEQIQSKADLIRESYESHYL